MFSSSHGFFGVQAGGSGTVPANVLTTPDIVTNVDDAAQAGRLITVQKAKELLGTPPDPAEAVVVGEVVAALPAPAAGNNGKLYILRTVASDETYLSNGATWTIQPDPDIGTECYVREINAVITWDGTRWGSGAVVPVQTRTLTADVTLDTRFATAWEVNAGDTDRTVTLIGDTRDPVRIRNTSPRARLNIQPDGGSALQVRPRVNAIIELAESGAYVWAS